MKPGLKTKADQEELWKAIDEGIVDTIGSDHAPHTIEEKQGHDVYGVPGVETTLPLLLDAVNKERITLRKIIELCCENPARIFRIRGKGKLQEGYDADLVIIDMDLEKEVKNEDMLTKCGWTPFAGMILKGWPVTTIVRGNIVYDSEEIDYSKKGKEVVFDGRDI